MDRRTGSSPGRRMGVDGAARSTEIRQINAIAIGSSEDILRLNGIGERVKGFLRAREGFVGHLRGFSSHLDLALNDQSFCESGTIDLYRE